jgi:UDP-glucose 4-epimerase
MATTFYSPRITLVNIIHTIEEHMISNWPTSSLRQVEKLGKTYSGTKVAVTGGASFIGSHLVDALLSLGAEVLVIDDLSSGKRENLKDHDNLSIQQVDLYKTTEELKLAGVEILFHLAAIHGGRGFIEKNSTMLLKNLTIDSNVFTQAKNSGVGTIVFASSACAYPIGFQSSSKDRQFLMEDSAGKMDANPMPDGMYGWTKLIGEYQLEKFADQSQMVARAARIFTAYGDRENESHAAIALIAKALLKMDPFPVWGDGEQTRNFTYVTDTVTGLLSLGSDKEPGFEICNVGTDQHITVNEFINAIFETLKWSPTTINHQLDKPAGVASRSSNNEHLESKYGWQPQVGISEGIKRTLSWYEKLPSRPRTAEELEEKLMSR